MNEPVSRPGLNILLITVDQGRADLFDRTWIELPHLRRLAAEGVQFTRHFNQAYPCGPARASLLTGLYAHKHRSIQNGTPLDARHPTLFNELRRAGYRPRLFGYTDTTLDPRGRAPLDPDRGDYENISPGLQAETLLTERATPWLAYLRRRGYPVADPDAGREGIFATRGFPLPAPFAAEDSETAFLTDRFLDWLGVAGAAPWCAHLSYIAPHPPFAAAVPFHGKVDPADVPLPIRGQGPEMERAQHPLVACLLDQIDLANFLPGASGLASAADEVTIRQVRAIYAGLVQEIDHHLGRIFAALEAQGAWDRTLIVFTADHGEQLFDHWLLGKTGYFDQSAHIPLIIRDPRTAANGIGGRTITAFTEAVDLMPTLLRAAGLEVPRNVDGIDLAPWLTGTRPAGWRDAVHWAFDFRDLQTKRLERALGLPSEWCTLQVLRTERFKYVHFAGLEPVLFDLHDDPRELVNRAADPARQALRLEGLDRMMTWRQRHEERTLTGLMARDGTLYEDSWPPDEVPASAAG